MQSRAKLAYVASTGKNCTRATNSTGKSGYTVGKVIYGVWPSTKQVACPMYDWYLRCSGWNTGSLTVLTPFWPPSVCTSILTVRFATYYIVTIIFIANAIYASEVCILVAACLLALVVM